MKRIGLDADDVIFDTSSLILEKLGIDNSNRSKLTKFSIEDTFNISKDEVYEAVVEACGSDYIEPVINAIYYLKKIISRYGRIWIISNRKSIPITKSIQQLENLGFDRSQFGIFHTANNEEGIPDKAPVVKGLELDVFVEDRLDTALDVYSKCRDCEVILMDAPWNRITRSILTRAYYWKDLYYKIIT
uniref:5' nucleotidase n=1 Tax=viral metagenome TaxID=1070528 RepID=A0A6M3LJL0_9ZZZZ